MLDPPVTKFSNEQEKAEIIFNDSVRQVDDTFYVDMPLIRPKSELQLGDSFSVALQRFLSLERKLQQNPILLEEYKNFIEQYVTPGHFLIGTALSSYPEVDLLEIPIECLRFWKIVSKLKQDFWKAWSADYLTQLQNRPKWKHSSPNLKVDDLVLVKKVNTSPLEWPMAKVVKICPGKDKFE